MPDPEDNNITVNPVHPTSQDVLTGIFDADTQPSQDEKWKRLANDDPVFAGYGLSKANKLRETGTDPGQAYLQGLADAHEKSSRQTYLDRFQVPDIFQLELPNKEAA
ncbi:MAG: hypothetical protein NVS1B10_05330 [Candidatus Saccharimonadales bacterium]